VSGQPEVRFPERLGGPLKSYSRTAASAPPAHRSTPSPPALPGRHGLRGWPFSLAVTPDLVANMRHRSGQIVVGTPAALPV
jgi:hypothetical protein